MASMLDLTKNKYSSQWRADNAKPSVPTGKLKSIPITKEVRFHPEVFEVITKKLDADEKDQITSDQANQIYEIKNILEETFRRPARTIKMGKGKDLYYIIASPYR